MKTFAELIASGTLAEIAVGIKSRSERFDALIADATKRGDGVNTQSEMAEMTQLDAESEQLTAKYKELKSFEDAKNRNAERIKTLKTPVNRPSFGSGDPDANLDEREYAKKAHGAVHGSVGALKYINDFETRRENEEHAFRFFKFWAANLPLESALRESSRQWCKDNGIALKALNEAQNEQGGALVPPEFDSMLIRLIEQFGRFRQFTRITPMASDTKTIPRRTAGITAVWPGEGKAITASNQTYDNVNLVAKKLAALAVMSSEITEDAAINIADEIAFEMAYAFSLSEDRAGFLGDGTSSHGGITGVLTKLKGLSGTIADIAGLVVAAGNLFSEFILADFEAAAGLLPQYADTSEAGWFCHRTFFYNVMLKLELASGGATANEVMRGDRRGRPLFLGYPVNFCQVFPRTDAISQIPVILGDLSLASTMGDRKVRTMFTDPYSLSANDQIQTRCTERIDIVVHDVGNATSVAADKQPGPIVGLISAAS